MKRVVLAVAACGLGVSSALGADPWADAVVSYVEGSGVTPGFSMPGSAIGEPTRFTGVGAFPAAVTPFNPPYLESEIVSIGPGGSLTVRFDEPVVDDPLNPYGIDLLIFGNAGFIDQSYPSGIMAGVFSAGGGVVEVSADGVNWFTVSGAVADGMYPTLGYLDLASAYSPTPGSVLADFTRPVDPAFDPTGLSFAQIVAGYAGSGGGAGIDLGAAGLGSVSYVRISNPAGATVNVDIDALADVSPVPGPGALAAVGMGVMMAAARRRRGA